MASFHSSRLSDFEMKWLLSSLLFQLAVISTAKIASPEPLASAGTARWRVILNCKVAGNPVVVEVRVTWEQGDAQRLHSGSESGSILDGEPASLDSPRFEAVTGALRLVVPPGCALVRPAASANA
jgi:hypothetical protein